MAYNDEALKAKLSTLNETQESIVSVSQWITFHRRYADRIAQVWLTRLRDAPPPKRLNYVYLVNDIVQNAKARKRTEFPNAFAPIIAEAVQQAYRSSTTDIQGKIKRVVEVWRTRAVFEDSILQAIQGRLEDVDKSKGSSGKKTLMGNSLFSTSSNVSMPTELESLAPLQTTVTKAEFASRPIIDTAQLEHSKITDPTLPQPSAPVYAANLSSLIKKLAGAEAGLSEAVAARKALIADLKRLIEGNEAVLSKDEDVLVDLTAKRMALETKKRDVEDNIMRGLAETEQANDDSLPLNDSRPDVEELTPEPEDFPAPEPEEAPTRNPNLQGILAGFGTSDDTTLTSPMSPPLNYTSTQTPTNGTGPSSSKKRKLSHDTYAHNEASVPDLGVMGVTGFDGPAESAKYPFMQPSMAPGEAPVYTSTLEQDVEALIRGSSGEMAG